MTFPPSPNSNHKPPMKDTFFSVEEERKLYSTNIDISVSFVEQIENSMRDLCDISTITCRLINF